MYRPHLHWYQILAPHNESVCYYDNEDKQFVNPNDVNKQDVKDGIITKVNLDREWALGKFCHGICRRKSSWLTSDRAEIAHYFYHWRYHLREQVKTALRQINYLNQEKKNYIRGLPSNLQNRYYQEDFLEWANFRVLDDVMDMLDRKRHIARVSSWFLFLLISDV